MTLLDAHKFFSKGAIRYRSAGRTSHLGLVHAGLQFHMNPAPLQASFCTAELFVATQLEQWETWVRQLHGQLSFDPLPAGGYKARLSFKRVRDIQMVRFDADGAALERTSQHVRRDLIDQYEFIAVLAGEVSIRHRRRRETVRAGQVVLVDASEPLRFEHRDPLSAVTLACPRHTLHNRMPGLENACGLAFAGSHSLAISAMAYTSALSDTLLDLDQGAFLRTSDHLLDLYVLMMNDQVDVQSTETAVQAATLRRIKAYIRCNLGDPSLDVGSMAAAGGISVRYLQTLFKTTGTTPRTYLRQARLEWAKTLLREHSWKTRSISEIALGVGFSNFAHFSTSFRDGVGMSPSEYRAEQGAPNAATFKERAAARLPRRR
ncbi:helix-turn-helix domain-containing protein [Ramlibacter sp. WS9]|uniref:helix-turn-helix domain-containing protein n=1 Tax=Ramlibacter sp. WS9 TaxID=1882741 RepID=UPI00114356DE|nr:AraC family transcriptional regulator [Ramlibacter sp. WS9]ROZ79395.1 AraC family transcriptional regulator [Ramlibacter sp. WS9]